MDETVLKYLLRDKLGGYETPPDDGDWEIIRRRLQQQKRRRATVLWMSTGAAAAAVALFFVLYPPSVAGPSPDIRETFAGLPEGVPPTVAGHAPAAPEAIRKTVAPTEPGSPAPEQPLLEAAQHETPAAGRAAADAAQTANPLPQAAANVKEETTETPPPVPVQDSLLPLFEDITLPEPAKRKKWAIALAAHSSGGRSAANAFDFMDKSERNGMLSDANFMYNASENVMRIDNVVEATHHIPLTFGLSFRFYFTSRWAVESGLAYTYLSSEYKYGNDGYRTKQRLHYLGWPVNAVYRILDHKRFSVYASGGGMLEKGLGARYTGITPSSHTDYRENIAGWQWSLNGQIGGSVRLSRHFSLYAEPGVRYFFPDPRQPESIRTERPFGFTLGFGIRTSF
ncbi:MAG: outer membrane beta-barrel protein [Prevotellaceae bacterium]|jgi:hypothetical protein|nr:outer membrane beta-barrel protein [Prevotellaceae bacterium]